VERAGQRPVFARRLVKQNLRFEISNLRFNF
jgi:hypothetical protein